MLLTPSRLPGADFVINPYIGCGFGCKYCYAKFMAKYVAGRSGRCGLSADKKELQQQWGKWVVPKIKDVDNFESEIKRMSAKLTGKTTLLSSVTDPYQPAEVKYKLTRKVLEIWANYAPTDAKLEILTRSALILRDIDILRQIPNLLIGMSLSILPQDKFRQIEPYSPVLTARINTLIKLKQARLKVYAFVAPVWPGQVAQLQQVVQELKKHKIPVRFIELLNKIARRQFGGEFEQEEILKLRAISKAARALLIEH